MPDPITRLNTALEGRYRIEREIGEGGMATVYLAADLKHEREVAIKVLKPDLAAVVGADRFLAEIRTTANLQHPHILPLFDSGEADGFLFYVMPYVEGESLRERLDREKQLPVGEAVEFAVKVAAALQAAHDRGVVHRDIKPANILLQNGEPLVADFGIALAVSQAGAARLTETGLSLGTPYYMAPEQAMGDRDPDRRSDLYSLACVTYEMLAGDPPFAASTAQAVLGKILTGSREPLEKLRPTTPAHVVAAIDQALERLPADRFGTVRDFADALNDPGFTSRASGPRTSVSAATASRLQEHGRLKRQLTLGAIGLVLVAVALAGWLRPRASSGDSSGPVPVIESRVHTPPEVRVELWTEFALSPSGDRLLFTGRDSAGVSRIWTRSLAGEAVAPLPGTENGAFPFWAPDGRAVGFTSRGALRVLDLETGRVRALCDVDEPNPATWTDDGAIYFSHLSSIHRTGPDGEACERVTDPDEGGTNHLWPTVLPGGRLVYSSRGATAGLWLLEPGGSPNPLVEGGWNATFVPPDWLVYHEDPREGTVPLLARRIDVESLEFLTPPAPVFDSIWTPNGIARYSVSQTGVLVAARSPASGYAELVWVDRSGEVEGRIGARSRTEGWTFDAANRGRRVAIAGWGLWVWDPSRGVVQQLPPGLGLRRVIQQPAWSPGDSLLAFGAVLDGPEGLFTYRLRDGRMDTLRTGPVGDVAWTPGGDTVVYRMGAGEERPQAEVRLHVRSSGRDERLFAAPASDPIQQTLEISPDGRWLLYSSTVSGVADLYLRALPELDAPRRVTSAGGLQGHWSERGDTIFYRTGGHELMAVPFGADGPESLGVARSLGGSDDLFEFWGLDGESGQFLRLERLEADRAPPIRLVTNWITRAEGRVP